MRDPLVPGVVILALMSASGCATIHKWQQEHRKPCLPRRQAEEAAARESGSKADRALRQKQAQDAARLPRLQSELAAQGDADSLAASALVAGSLSGFDNGTALDLATRAVATAPDRADLALLQLQLCESAPASDP